MSDQTEYLEAYLDWCNEPRDTSPLGYQRYLTDLANRDIIELVRKNLSSLISVADEPNFEWLMGEISSLNKEVGNE